MTRIGLLAIALVACSELPGGRAVEGGLPGPAGPTGPAGPPGRRGEPGAPTPWRLSACPPGMTQYVRGHRTLCIATTALVDTDGDQFLTVRDGIDLCIASYDADICTEQQWRAAHCLGASGPPEVDGVLLEREAVSRECATTVLDPAAPPVAVACCLAFPDYALVTITP